MQGPTCVARPMKASHVVQSVVRPIFAQLYPEGNTRSGVVRVGYKWRLKPNSSCEWSRTSLPTYQSIAWPRVRGSVRITWGRPGQQGQCSHGRRVTGGLNHEAVFTHPPSDDDSTAAPSPPAPARTAFQTRKPSTPPVTPRCGSPPPASHPHR